MKKVCRDYSRKQILVIWTDDDGRHSARYPRTERGEQSANNRVARLVADGYAQVDAPKDWYAALIDAAQKAREARASHD